MSIITNMKKNSKGKRRKTIMYIFKNLNVDDFYANYMLIKISARIRLAWVSFTYFGSKVYANKLDRQYNLTNKQHNLSDLPNAYSHSRRHKVLCIFKVIQKKQFI